MSTGPALKTEGYLINTLHLDRCDTAFVCEYFNHKAEECQGADFLKSLPIILALENAGDLHGFDFHKIKDHAASLGFNVVGLSATTNPKIALFIKTWKLPVFMTRKSSDDTPAATVQPASSASVQSTSPVNTVNVQLAENTSLSGTDLSQTERPNLNRPGDIIIENPYGVDDGDENISVADAMFSGLKNGNISSSVSSGLQTIKAEESTFSYKGPAPSTVVVTPVKPAVKAPEPQTVQTVQNQNNAAAVQDVQPAQTVHTAPVPENNGEVTMIYTGNVRSGNSLYAKNKSLTVIGNVGDGAEIAADDCITVFGSARGRICAGGPKNTKSIIYCHDFRPQLVSIAGIYSTIENMPQDVIGHKVLVTLKNNKLEYKIQD